jgi:hypothetical protein
MHGELLKLGIRVAQSTVSIYMVPRRGRPLQTWKTFIHNHAEGIASIDLFASRSAFKRALFSSSASLPVHGNLGNPAARQFAWERVDLSGSRVSTLVRPLHLRHCGSIARAFPYPS